jgi:hypothetical protein
LNALTTSGGGDVIPDPADALFGIAKLIINKKRKNLKNKTSADRDKFIAVINYMLRRRIGEGF